MARQPSVRVGRRPARKKELFPAPEGPITAMQVRPAQLLPQRLDLELAAEEEAGILQLGRPRGPGTVCAVSSPAARRVTSSRARRQGRGRFANRVLPLRLTTALAMTFDQGVS